MKEKMGDKQRIGKCDKGGRDWEADKVVNRQIQRQTD